MASFHTDGYLVLNGFASAEECGELRQRAEVIVDEFDPDGLHSIFSTKDQKETTDEHFLRSAAAVSCFFEEKAFNAAGTLVKDKALAINKIGHAMHDLDPVFTRFSRSKALGGVLLALGLEAPTPVQSMYIFKQPFIGGEVVPHQDSTFLYTDPPTCVGAWFALEDATLQNGCLWIQPGSHTRGVARRMKLTAERAIAFEGQLPEFDMSSFVPLEVAAGALVLLHGAVWHMSHENTSPRSRHAYSVHFVEERTQWDDANWLQRPTDIPFKALAL